MHVVVVESPAKAKTLRRLLGTGHTVIATGGKVRDLPAKDGSVDPASGFALVYATRRGAVRSLRSIAAALEEADTLVLATDPDREGEAIAWQVWSWLEDNGTLGDTPVHRVAFHEVTRDAVRAAMERPRALDMDLVRAQQARRALDYLVGFHLSPVLWRKVRGGRSAGRVQSVALRLVCAREAEIEDFVPLEYWTVEADVMAEGGGSFTARLGGLDGEALHRHALGTGKRAEEAARRIREGAFRVAALVRDTLRRSPVPPFTTSTLQQEASRRLGFGVRKTMQIAQTLYEGVDLDGETAGLVTYVVLYRRRFVPTERGRVVTAFLERYFARWVAYRFTTDMEADLDRVAAGGTAWTGVLESFWGPFEGAVGKARELRREDIRGALESALERYLFAAAGEPVERSCPACADAELILKLGRFGPFVSCASFPECRYRRPLSGDPAEREEVRRPVALGTDAETGLALTLRSGRYGRYIQRGEDEGKTRALRRTVPASMEADEITPEVARALLALPRIVGVHPETGKTIRAGIGRYGAWLKHGATYVPLPDDEDALTVGLNRAVALVDARIG